VLAAVAAARDADSGGGQRAEVALELGEVLVAAVAGVDVQDDQTGGDPGADVGLRPPRPPASDPGGVAGSGVQAVAQLVGAISGLVGW
jgi:hypothetical protein